jgi:hypothetical protein
MGTQTGIAHLAGYIIRQYADRVRIREKNGMPDPAFRPIGGAALGRAIT